MRFSASEEVEAPVEAVYTAITDFPRFERALIRNGADLRRLEPGADHAQGAAWEIEMPVASRPYRIEVRLVEPYPLEGYRLTAHSSDIEGWAVVELVRLSPRRTRIEIAAELTPVTLAPRLLVQLLNLAKPKIDARLATTLSNFARTLEAQEDLRC